MPAKLRRAPHRHTTRPSGPHRAALWPLRRAWQSGQPPRQCQRRQRAPRAEWTSPVHDAVMSEPDSDPWVVEQVRDKTSW